MKVIMLGQPQDMPQGQLAAFAHMMFGDRVEIMWESDFRSQEGALDVGWFVHNLKMADCIVSFTDPARDLLIPLAGQLWGNAYRCMVITFHAARQTWFLLHDGEKYTYTATDPNVERRIVEVKSSPEVMYHLKNMVECYPDDPAKCADCATRKICIHAIYAEQRKKDKAAEGAE